MRFSEDQVAYVIGTCQKVSGLEGIYVFGSTAKENFSEASDFDLGIKATTVVDPIVLWDLKNEIAQKLHVEVDLVDMRAIDTVLLMQIVSTGKRLYTTDERLSEAFESLVFSQYLKLNDDRAEILEAIAKSGKVYG